MKYYINFCNCGTIHAIDKDKLYEDLDKEKSTVLICANCGAATIIGADIFYEQDEITGKEIKSFYMYCRDLSPCEDMEITSETFQNESLSMYHPAARIIYSHGHRVPMKTDNYANSFFAEKFSDMIYPDFYKIQKKDITVDEIMNFINDFNEERTTVNMERFIRETPHDVLEEISGFCIKGLNWAGTEFDRDNRRKHYAKILTDSCKSNNDNEVATKEAETSCSNDEEKLKPDIYCNTTTTFIDQVDSLIINNN